MKMTGGNLIQLAQKALVVSGACGIGVSSLASGLTSVRIPVSAGIYLFVYLETGSHVAQASPAS